MCPFPSPLKFPTLRPLETSPPFDPEGFLHRLWAAPWGRSRPGSFWMGPCPPLYN